MANIEQIIKVFSEQGALSQSIAGFRPRAEQREMATAVASAIQDKQALVVEAGTGTENLCLSSACFISEKETIVSTGSKNLQDQLFKRDLPAIKKPLITAEKLRY